MKSNKKKKDRAISRRRALAGVGLLGLGAAGCRGPSWSPPEKDEFSRALVKPPVPGAGQFATHEERWVKSSCAQCPAGCGIKVRVVEGRAVRVEGNPDNPLNRGGIGVRGLSSLQALYDSGRLRQPMVRGAGGKLEPASWKDALGRVGEALARVRGKSPDKLLLWCGRERGVVRDLFARFAAAFGTPSFLDGFSQRGAPIAQAMRETLGSYELPAYDWAGARQVLSLEAGLLEDSCQSVYFARVAAELRRNGGDRARIVHAGGTFDLSARNADHWLRIRPGTGGALAMGLCQVLIAERRYDAGFVEQRTEGFDELARLARRYTPDRVAQITGLESDDVTRLARELWQRRPAFALVDERSVSFSSGREAALAALSLNALLGAVDALAGGLRVAPSAPLAPWPELSPDAARAAPPVAAHLPEALARGAAEVALLYQIDPVGTRADPELWRRALSKVPLVVSFSSTLDPTTAEVADVVLPEHTYLERWEDAGAAPGPVASIVGIRRPAIEPLFDTRAAGDSLLALARGLGGDVAAAFPWRDFKHALDARLVGLRGQGGVPDAADDKSFLDALYERGLWTAASPPPPGERRFRFVAAAPEPTFAGDAKSYPLRLVLYHPLGHVPGPAGAASMPWLETLRPRPYSRPWQHAAAVHPDAVKGLGVATGDRVTIESPHGAVEMPLALDERVEPGYLMVPVAAPGTRQVNPLVLVAEAAVPETGATPLAATRGRIRAGGVA